MRPVSELYGKHAGEDIYVVGTGASLRVFPLGFFESKTTIGLNMAWRTVPVRYSVTIHPDLNVPEFISDESHQEITWIAPYEKSRALLSPRQFAIADERFYSFEYFNHPNTQPSSEPSDSGRVIDWVRQATGNSLYVWSSIAQTGVNLAANLGAKNIILVGCDNGSLSGNHHAQEQHTRWKGVEPDHRYRQYYEGMAEVRSALRERGVNLVSMQPFLGVTHFEEDFQRLCDELNRSRLIQGNDISPKPGVAGRFAYYVRRVWRRVIN